MEKLYKKMEHSIEIQNLKCGGCANTITQKLSELEGVSQVHVNEENSIVSIDVVSQDLLVAIQDKLINLGYPPVGQENSIGNKAKSYVSCAIGRFS